MSATRYRGRMAYQRDIEETVGWFVGRAIPDPEPGWEDSPWRIEEMGRTEDGGTLWRVAVDVPTSVKGMGCWLSFKVIEPGDARFDAYVDEVHAVRSGRGDLDCEVFVWDDHEGMWVTPPDDDENG